MLPLMLTLTLLFLLVPTVCSARVHAPRVVSPRNADAYSMKTFAQHHRWHGLSGDALAWEVYQYLVDRHTGMFHMNEVLEGDDTLSEYRTVRDPVKLINVYGYGYCGIFGPFMAGVCEGIGLGPSRMLVLPLWNHVATETFYDERWHYLDVDVRAVFRRSDGTLASMQDAKEDSSLWTGRGPLFFPNDPLDRTREIYEQTEVQRYYGFHSGGHTMDFVLRQGEIFTRWWKPQDGRWHHVQEYGRSEWLMDLITQEPRGPKPNHRHFTVHNHGNGLFVYEPNLTAGSTDFEDGVYDSHNVQTTEAGLRVQASGSGIAIFEIRSPYITVPKVGRPDTTEDDCEASVVELDAEKTSVAISLDNGLTWHSIGNVTGHMTLDLTDHVSGTYGYLLKLALADEDGQSIVRSMRVTTWVQVAPASLPSLRQGVNRMELRTGDHHGLDTRVVELRPDASDPESFLKHCYQSPVDHDPTRKTSRIQGDFVVQVNAAPNTKIAWLSIGGSFRTHQREAAASTRNEMAIAVDTPDVFETIYQSDIPTDNEHWHTNADVEIVLPQPAQRVYVHYSGDPAVNSVRIYAHCVDNKKRVSGPIQVTHGWLENGELRTYEAVLDEAGQYEVTTRGEPEDVFVQMSIPSSPPRNR